MTNNKNKTAIETIIEFVKGGMPYMAYKPADRDLYGSIAELDARISALETSAKASEPNDERSYRGLNLPSLTQEESYARRLEPKECKCFHEWLPRTGNFHKCSKCGFAISDTEIEILERALNGDK